MYVQATVRGNSQHLGWQDGAVGGHADDVRLKRGQLALNVGSAQRARRADFDPIAESRFLYRRRRQTPAAAAHRVGTRVNSHNLVLLHKVV